MLSSIQQAASSIQAVSRGYGSGNGAVTNPAGAGPRAVKAPEASLPEKAAGNNQSPAREARETDEAGVQDERQDAAQQLVSAIETKTSVRANLAVIKTADLMLGSLLDVVA